MLRRALLLAVLAAPLAALGQTISIVPPSPYTASECSGTTTNVTLYWGLPIGTTVPSGATYRILVSTTDECSTASSALVVASDIVPDTSGDPTGATSQRYPAAGSSSTLTVNTFASKAGVDCTANPKMYTCVQLMNGSTVLASSPRLGLQVESGPPSIPVNVGVSPGDGALLVGWVAGTDSSVATTSYRVTAARVICSAPLPVPLTEACLDPVIASQGTTASTSIRLPGLVIGTLYGVRVYAISGTGTQSAASAIATGTPINVFDYWDKYKSMGGLEEGGCAAGSAGVLSLLAVAGLVRSLRRRP